ncbi:Rab geranylgeranyltransferase [Tritrichomonas musculus]|uniref:Geranylgeranyl transferase type-2 subunit beta n=1 Tax=Tritrichomonas musculus TaxID=1915356 RepID=A0ABR2L5C1_9EUKA
MTLNRTNHINFIHKLINDRQSSGYFMTISIRTNNYYWALGVLYLLDAIDQIDKKETVDFILSTQSECGGFGGNTNFDPHIHTTLSAIQCLIFLDSIDKIDKEKVCRWVASLQNPDGSFKGDEWGEVDTKFAYCGLSILSLLGHLDYIDVSRTVDWILSCQNFDGGFGCVPGCESHAGQIFSSLAALSIANALNKIDKNEIDALGLFLSERQDYETGGLYSRPEKLADVCYTWWVGASLAIIDKKDWINAENLEKFVLSAQNSEIGGIADVPGHQADPFHTFFGLAGLSIFHCQKLPEMDPVYAMPKNVLEKHFLSLKNQS